MALFQVDVWIPVGDDKILRKVTYFFEGDGDNPAPAKAKAVELFIKNEVPKLLAVSWIGPIAVEKIPVSSPPKKKSSTGTKTS